MTPAMSKKAKHRWYLREWRKHRGYTQERLAEMTGLSKPYISQLERGEREYNQHLLDVLADALRCEPGHLVTVDPARMAAIWSIWETLTTPQREQAVAVIEAIKKTGTHG